MRKLAWIISIIFFGFFTQLIILILNELGLFAVIELDEPILVSSYDDYYLEDTFTTPLGIAVYGIGFILSYWLFKFIDQKTLKITYEKKETEGSKDAAKFFLFYGILTTIVLKLLGDSTGGLTWYIRTPSEAIALIVGCYFFLRKYWNPFG